MANGLLSYVNHVDAAMSVSVTGALASLPGSNVQDPILGRVSRVLSTTWRAIIDLGEAKEIGAVALAGISGIGSGATFQVEMGSIAGSGAFSQAFSSAFSGSFSAGYDSATDGGATAICSSYGYGVHIPDAAQTYRHLRLTVTDGSASAIDVGRAWAGPVFRPAKNFAFGYAEVTNDASVRRRAPYSGAEYVDQRAQWRGATPAWEFLSETEARDTWREINRLVGRRGQILFVPDPESSRLCSEVLIGRIDPPAIEQPYHDVFAVRLTLEESK